MSNKEKNLETLSVGNAPATEALPEEQVQRLVEKYDTESRYRRLTGWQGYVVSAWCIAMSLFHMYTAGIGLLPTAIQRAVHLTFALAAVFLLYPASPKLNRTKIPWYDWILATLAVVGVGYIVFFFNEIARRGARPLSSDVVLGVLTIVLVLEAGRRIVGKVLPTLAFLFLLYCAFGRYAPGMFMHRGYSLSRIIQHMYLTPEGLFGVPWACPPPLSSCSSFSGRFFPGVEVRASSTSLPWPWRGTAQAGPRRWLSLLRGFSERSTVLP